MNGPVLIPICSWFLTALSDFFNSLLVELNLSAIGSEFYSRTEGDRKHAVNDVATMASRTASVATIRAVGSRHRPGDRWSRSPQQAEFLSSSRRVRRQPEPMNTSSQRTGSVIAFYSVSILSLTVQTRPQTRRSG
jgi:hypothetical protein